MHYSKQREEILDTVRSTDCHPTADWVYEKVRQRIASISLGTVYRNLNLLVEIGQISSFRDGSAVRYDRMTDKHHHFKCAVCDTVIDVETSEGVTPETLIDSHRFEISDMRIELTGTCKKCLNKKKENK